LDFNFDLNYWASESPDIKVYKRQKKPLHVSSLGFKNLCDSFSILETAAFLRKSAKGAKNFSKNLGRF